MRAPSLALVGVIALALAGCPAPRYVARNVAPVVAVPDSLAGRFAVYTGDGTPTTLFAVATAMGQADAVFLGEEHDDAVTHALQLVLLQEAQTRYGAGDGYTDARPLALGMEMAERDVQQVLDEYLAGTIRERDYLAAARPWSNYAPHYRPLVEFAREHNLPVLATNAPGRYVNLTSRQGEAALRALPSDARAFLPPLPVAPPSEALAAKFRAEMGDMPGHSSPHGNAGPTVDGMLAAQNLRDAAMADGIAQWLRRNRGGLVVHVNGRFHSEGGLGVPQHLARDRRGVRTVVVTFRKAEDPMVAPGASDGDTFVVLTQAPPETDGE